MKKMIFPLLFALGLTLALPAHAQATGETKNPLLVDTKEVLEKDGKEDSHKQGKPAPLALDEVRFEFVRTNIISTFYHELGHGLVDVLELPVLGQEEDAADVFSVLAVEALFDSAEAMEISAGAARGFEVDALAAKRRNREWDWADVHGPDMQRYYNIVCLAYGVDTDSRDGFAKHMNLPEDRMDTCADEYELAARGWGQVIDRISKDDGGVPMRFESSARTSLQKRAAAVVEQEVARVNDSFSLPTKIRVDVKRCGRDSNFYAFYSEGRRKITMCTNYIDELYRDAPIP